MGKAISHRGGRGGGIHPVPDLTIGRLKGRYVVSWHDTDGKRRRYRLQAQTRADAEREAIDVHRRETLGPRHHATIADLWEAYCEEKEGRPVVKTMGFEAKAMMPVLGHYRADQLSREHVLDYTAKRRKAGIKDGTI
jgi:hypothetical protein